MCTKVKSKFAVNCKRSEMEVLMSIKYRNAEINRREIETWKCIKLKFSTSINTQVQTEECTQN